MNRFEFTLNYGLSAGTIVQESEVRNSRQSCHQVMVNQEVVRGCEFTVRDSWGRWQIIKNQQACSSNTWLSAWVNEDVDENPMWRSNPKHWGVVPYVHDEGSSEWTRWEGRGRSWRHSSRERWHEEDENNARFESRWNH